MPLTGLDPEVKKRLLASRGLSSDRFDILDDGSVIQKQPSSAPEDTGLSALTEQNVNLRQPPSVLESAGRGFAENIGPTAVGALGAAGTLALIPEPIVTKIGALGAASVGGIAALISAFGASKAQKALVPQEIQQRLFTRPEDVATNPLATTSGSLLSGAPFFNPVRSLKDIPTLISAARKTPQLLSAGRSALTPAEEIVAANALVNASIGAGRQLPEVISGERPFSAKDVGVDVLAGLLGTRPTRFGRAIGFREPPSGEAFDTRPPQPTIDAETGRVIPETVVPRGRGFGPFTTEEASAYGAPITRGQPKRVKAKDLLAETPETLEPVQVEQARNEAKLRQLEEQKLAEESPAAYKKEAAEEIKKETEYDKIFQAEQERKRLEAENTRLKQEAENERLRLENEALKQQQQPKPATKKQLNLAIGAKKGYGREATMETRLQAQVEKPRLAEAEKRPPVTEPEPPIISPKEAPLTEAERIQQEYDLGKRHAEESELPLSNKPIEEFTPEARAKFKASAEAEAKRRGYTIKYVDKLTNAEGKEILGRYNRATREIELHKTLAAGDIPSHEVAHGYFYDLLKSSAERDRDLALRGLESADTKGRKFKTVEEFEALHPEEQKNLEEAFVKQLGVEGYKQKRIDLYGKKREKFVQWFNNVKAHVKSKFGAANAEDLQRFFTSRVRSDVPFGSRPELSATALRSTATAGAKPVSAEKSELPGEGPGAEPIKPTIPPEKVTEGVKETLGTASVKAASEATRAQKNEENALRHDKIVELRNLHTEVTDELRKKSPLPHPESFVTKGMQQVQDYEQTLRDYLGDEYVDEKLNEWQRLHKEIEEAGIESKEAIRETNKAFEKANKKSEEYFAFAHAEPTRNAEESSLPDEKTSSAPSKTLGFFASQIDKIRNQGNPTAKYVADKLEQHATERSILEGRYRNVAQQMIADSNLSKSSLADVDKYGREIWSEGKSDVVLSAEEKALYDKLQSHYQTIVEESPLKKVKPQKDYWPIILNEEVASAWNKNPNSPTSKYYKNQWMDYAEKKNTSYSTAELSKILNDYVDSVASHGDNPTLEFGALRKAEDIGLPISLQDNNIYSRWSRFGKRAAKDTASAKLLENDPVMRRTLRIKNPETDRVDRGDFPKLPSGEQAEDISGSQDITNLKKQIYEKDSNLNHPYLQSAQRLLSSVLLGPATGIRNLANAPAIIAPLIGGTRNIKSLAAGLADITNSWRDAFTYNVRQRNLNDLQWGSAAHPDKIVSAVNKLADGIRKWTGRDLLEQGERTWLFAVAKHAATAELGRSTRGDVEAQRWLKEWGSNVEGGVEQYFKKNIADVPDDAVNRIAKKVADYAAGTYDERGLPAGVLEGDLAPFLRLGRWSLERANTTINRVIKPAIESGNYQPLLSYVASSMLTGVAIKELNEILSGGKKAQEASISESLKANNYQEAARATFAIAQLGSLAGIISDSLKAVADIGTGHKPFRGPLSYPLGSFVSEDVVENLSNLKAAIDNGEPKYDATLEFLRKLSVDSVQAARLLYSNSLGKQDAERANKFRDIRIFKELTGRRVPEEAGEGNPFFNIAERKFKRSTDIGEALGMLPNLFTRAVEKGEDFEGIRKNIAGLKRNSYQTFPDFERNPIEASQYLEFLTQTQGAPVAISRLVDYLKQKNVNKVKSSLIPSF